jgi:predicted N-formylglutamate amidohydrolase
VASAAPRPVHLLLTCEHASHRVPAPYRSLFAARRAVIATHRGWDIGALALAQAMARATGAPLYAGRVTRLLVDLNRSPGHPRLFSEFTRELPPGQQRALIARYHAPHWRVVQRHIRRRIARGERVVHVAVHSFTPVLAGQRRRADIGLLYDPARRWEGQIVTRWQRALQRELPRLTVLRNSPYRGTSDGLPTAMRRIHPAAAYAGIELEVNQRWPSRLPAAWRQVVRALTSTLPDLEG